MPSNTNNTLHLNKRFKCEQPTNMPQQNIDEEKGTQLSENIQVSDPCKQPAVSLNQEEIIENTIFLHDSYIREE